MTEKKKPKKNTISDSFIIQHIIPLKTTEVYDTYWKFATERQDIFFKRFNGSKFPWTEDSIIAKYKFTNVYRATDRVSQYLIKEVIYNSKLPSSALEVFFRVLLFKLFNKIETWELLSKNLGELTWKNYNFNRYDRILSKALKDGIKIYSGAYIMPSGKSSFGRIRKHSNHLKLIEFMIESDTHESLGTSKRMQDAFEIIKGFPGLGDFLAYQLLIDLNYSSITNFLESEFVVPGPGAKGGISKCFTDLGGLNHMEVIKFMTDRQDIEFERLGLNFKTIWGRKLQLIDCQNIFCEVDKYSRVKHPTINGNSDRNRIKQMFKPNSQPINLWFPPKWGINENIQATKA